MIMTKLSKILLSVAVAGIGVGSVIASIGVNGHPWLAALLPLGAVSLGLFLIVFMLEKEMAKYDEEQATKLEGYEGEKTARHAPETTMDAGHVTGVALKERTL